MKYNHTKSALDHRDHYVGFATSKINLPDTIDLRNDFPPVFDQGQLGSCTANAICAAFEYRQIIEKKKDTRTSRLFVYINERIAEGTVSTDSGATLRTGMQCMYKQGVCNESDWPYLIQKFAQIPPKQCYEKALSNRISSYVRVPQTLDQIRSFLLQKLPVVFGFLVYESFESKQVARTGIVSYPNTKKEKLLGGHAVTIVGHSMKTRRFIVRNSWGTRWGQGGYFEMVESYVLDNRLAFDFWVLGSTAQLKSLPASVYINPSK